MLEIHLSYPVKSVLDGLLTEGDPGRQTTLELDVARRNERSRDHAGLGEGGTSVAARTGESGAPCASRSVDRRQRDDRQAVPAAFAQPDPGRRGHRATRRGRSEEAVVDFGVCFTFNLAPDLAVPSRH